MKPRLSGRLAAASAALSLLVGCNSEGSGLPPQLDAGHKPDTSTGTDSSPPPLDGGTCANLVPAPALPAQDSLQPATLLLTASGESLAVNGYNFPAENAGDPVFADGWAVSFAHFIATFDRIKLWTNPDMVPTDQSVVGALVAELDGPWAVDMSKQGVEYPYIPGKETGETAVAFAVLANQNKSGNAPFPTDGTKLAVGFSAITATPQALNVNLDAEGLCAYQTMIENGCVALYVGTATWKGNVRPGRCETPGSDNDGGGVGAGGEPEFASIPTTVNFNLCFRPAVALAAGAEETGYINCDNQDNMGPGPNGEPHPRGIAFVPNTYSVGEVTFHTDHPFWESTKHDRPAHFDQFAALVSGQDGGTPTVFFTDTIGVDYTGFKDKQGSALNWRICDPNYDPSMGSRTGQMHFDPVAVPHCTGGDHANGLCDYYDYSKYNQSTQGHWNGADGLCFVRRQYPSPQ